MYIFSKQSINRENNISRRKRREEQAGQWRENGKSTKTSSQWTGKQMAGPRPVVIDGAFALSHIGTDFFGASVTPPLTLSRPSRSRRKYYKWMIVPRHWHVCVCVYGEKWIQGHKGPEERTKWAVIEHVTLSALLMM